MPAKRRRGRFEWARGEAVAFSHGGLAHTNSFAGGRGGARQ
jgi:hypothetical protein